MISGTRIRLVTLLKPKPCMPATTASAFAVLPLDNSTTWLPCSTASSSSGRAMFQAARSLTEPKGLSISSFANRSMLRRPCTAGSIRTNGVLPIASVMLSYLTELPPRA
ncbi:hypothetical protein SVIOM74S_05487 [Streptomyces violarus]